MGQDNGMGGLDFSTMSEGEQSHTSGMDRGVLFFYKPTYGDVETHYGKVIDLCASLKTAGSLSLEMALECDRLAGSELAKLYFSDTPRQKKYEMALEEMDTKTLLIGGGIAAAFVAFLGFIIKHFVDKRMKDGSSLGSNTFQELAESLKNAQHEQVSGEALEAVNKEMSTAGKGNVAQERYENAHSHQIRALMPLQADILATGEYSKLIAEMLRVNEDIQPVVVLKSAGHAYRTVNTTLRMNQDHLKSHYFQIMAEPRKAHAALNAEVNKVVEKQNALNNGNVTFPKDINHALRNFTEAVTNPVVGAYVKEREHLVSELERMRSEAQEIQKQGGTPTQGGTEARDILKEIHGLLAVILKTDMLFQKYWQNVITSAHYLHAIVSNARWDLSKTLRDKGYDPKRIALDSNVVQLERIAHILDSFKKRVG
ncbi:MAG: hypothetical protein P4L77_11540 [Sulfuriferula sp.]|nr:hypothetical protein [Sulfuriferula sp.]